MHCQIITLFPELVEPITRHGVVGKAFEQGTVTLETINPRDFTDDVHRTVDDRPYGGGPGMVMKPEPLARSIDYARANQPDNATAPFPVIYLSPQGRTWSQPMAQSFSSFPGVVLICGRYEGIDQRFIDRYVDMEISIGDAVLSGGELPAMLMMDSLIRLIPGVLGHADSASEDSFSGDNPELLDHPHYTRPETWQDEGIPAILKSGDHQKIRQWRRQQAENNTWQRRPERVKSRA